MAVLVLCGDILQMQKETELFMSREREMKTLTSCKLLRVTDGCISMWESQMR